MTTWVDSIPNQSAVDDVLAAMRAKPTALWSQLAQYSRGDERFTLWLYHAQRRCLRVYGLGIFDLADFTWRDQYDAGVSPHDALHEAMENDDIGAMMLRETEQS